MDGAVDESADHVIPCNFAIFFHKMLSSNVYMKGLE